MSEVNIEKKDSGGVPWWAWLLGALVLGALIWYATAAMSAKPGATTVAAVDNTAMAPAVADTNAAMTDTNSAMMTNTAMVPAADTNMAMMDNSAMMANAAPAMTDTNSAMMANSAMNDVSMSNSATGVSTVPATGSGKAITNILSIVDAKDPASLYNQKVELKGAPVQAAGTKMFWVGPSFEQKMLVVTDASTNMNGMNNLPAQRDRVDITGTLMEIKDFDAAKKKYDLDDSAVTFLTNKKLLLMATSVKRDKN